MSDLTLQTAQNNITIRVSRIGGNPVYSKTGITITPGEDTVIDTGQSSTKPRIITAFNSSDKRIDKNLPEPVVTLSTNYIITYPAQLIPYSNVTIYYI